MEQPTSTFHLFDRVKNGDRGAVSVLIDRHRRRLAVMAYYRLGPHLRGLVEVDDILQETLLKAYQQLDQFTYRGPGSFLGWLSLIMNHVIADAARYHGRQKRNAGEMLSLRSDSVPGGVEPVDTQTPSRIIARDENLRIVLQALDGLPEEYREVILLARIEGLPTKEVAERMGKTREAVSLLLHRATRRFKQIMGERNL